MKSDVHDKTRAHTHAHAYTTSPERTQTGTVANRESESASDRDRDGDGDRDMQTDRQTNVLFDLRTGTGIWYRIEMKQVVFLWRAQDSNSGVSGTHSSPHRMPTHKPTEPPRLTHLPIVPHMCQYIGSALVSIMVCSLSGAKPLSKPLLGCCLLDPQEQTSLKF